MNFGKQHFKMVKKIQDGRQTQMFRLGWSSIKIQFEDCRFEKGENKRIRRMDG
jgi:hypothetical protein